MQTPNTPRPIRVLVSKPGLDGHDVGAKLVCRALSEAGMEVIYTGLRKSPDTIAELAKQNQVDVVALSILSGAHIALCTKVGDALKHQGLEHVLWIVGGNIPSRDHQALKDLGVKAIFAVGSPLESIVEYVQKNAPSGSLN